MKRMPILSKHRIIFVLSVVLVAMLIVIWAERVGENDSPEAIVTFELDTGLSFDCELADSESERAIGLMNRESLDSDKGMLFMFETSQNVSFWMKNTLIPLDIIFIDENLKVVNVAEAVPEPGVPDNQLTRYSSERPVKWVLEINKGISSENGISMGTSVNIDIS